MAKKEKDLVPGVVEPTKPEEPTSVDNFEEVEESPRELPERAYTFEVLRKNSRELFGVNKEILDGAFYKEDLEKNRTIKEVKEKVNAFLKKEVK